MGNRNAIPHIPKLNRNRLDEFTERLLLYPDLEAKNRQLVKLTLMTEFPAGTRFSFRKTLAGREQNRFNTFMDQRSSASWLKKRFNKYGNAADCLNAVGKAQWEKYQNSSPRERTETQFTKTVPAPNGGPGSNIIIETQLPLFSFEKIEVRRAR